MEIRALDREVWAGYAYREAYTTPLYYDVQVQPRGFSLELREADPPLERVMSDTLFAGWLEAPVAYGAFDGETLMGAVEGSPESWHRVFRVSNLFVSAPYRRQGVGRALLAHIVDEARRQGVYRGAMLETQTCNVPAIALYEQMGFSLCRIDRCEYTNDDVANREARIDLFLAF